MTPGELSSISLRELCGNAYEVGNVIDLSGCQFGPNRKTGRREGVKNYYPFLAGFARIIQCRSILEIGTHCGGSASAMWAGCGSVDTKFVTIDINDHPDLCIKGLNIVRIVGDAHSPEVVDAAIVALTVAPIDILYIDAEHTYRSIHTELRMYGPAFRPRFVVMDDIHNRGSVTHLWKLLARCFGAKAYYASPLLRRFGGFGVLDNRENLLDGFLKNSPREYKG